MYQRLGVLGITPPPFNHTPTLFVCRLACFPLPDGILALPFSNQQKKIWENRERYRKAEEK